MDSSPTPFGSHERHAQSGFTIIEVLVAALILSIVAAGSAVAFVGAVGTSGIQRSRSAAEALAQQDESKLRGYPVSQLANLRTTLPSVSIDNTKYTVSETATFVSDSSGNPSCTNPSADYLDTTSSVTWQGMPSNLPPVTVSGVITPTFGQIGPNTGVLAVQVQDPGGNAIAGMPVSVSQTSGGSAGASGATASNGCVLFGDLPTGNYTVNVTPANGPYVDAKSNQGVGASSPDSRTNVPVSAGTTASSPVPFILTTPGAATLSFTDAWPTGVSPSPAPTATSPSVILANANLAAPSYVVCSAQDSTCPTVSQPDTSWGQSAWSTSPGSFTAQPLVPGSYSTYAGICPSDEPKLSTFGGSDTPATIAAGTGNPTSINLTLPAIVVRLYSGTGSISILGGLITIPRAAGSEEGLPSGSELVVTDTGCGEPYVGGPGVSTPTNDSYLPVNSSPTLGGTGDTGVLGDPGMPDGQYTVCLQYNGNYYQTSIVNKGSGEVVNVYVGTPTGTGSCQV